MKNLWAVILILACGTLRAQMHRPDINGTWKLRVAKSFMGSEHPSPRYEFTKIIAVRGSRLSMTDIQNNATIVNIPLPDSKITSELTLDGTEQNQQKPGSFPGTPSTNVKTSGEWQGGTLFIQLRGQMLGQAMTLHQRYFLSDDGLQLIELIEQHGITGDKEQTLVFEKD